MAYIKKLDEMAKRGNSTADASYIDGFSKRYPSLFVEKGDAYYSDVLKNYEDCYKRYTKPQDMAARVKHMQRSVSDYLSRAKERSYDGMLNIPDEVLANFYNMTDNNYHVEVRYEIALYLSQYSDEMYEFVSYFGNMLKDDKLKTNRFHSAYLIMDGLMSIKIAAIFGDEVLGRIDACL